MMRAPVERVHERRICGLRGTFVIARGIANRDWMYWNVLVRARALSKDVDTYFQKHMVTTQSTVPRSPSLPCCPR